ncbi:MAG: type II and III secretion system protein, partial [Thermotogae bacterium]|nr:type II and III secretion system protein [Thermotogota bacterium]
YPKVTIDYIDGGSKLFIVGTSLEIEGIKRILKDFDYVSEPQKTEFIPVPPKYIDDLVDVISGEYQNLVVKKIRGAILLLRGPGSKIDDVKRFIDSIENLFESREVKIIRKIVTLDPKTMDNAKNLIKIVVPSVKSDSIDELGVLVLEGTPDDVQEALKLVEGYVVKDEDIETVSVVLKGLDYSKVNDLLKFYELEGKVITYYIPDINLLLMRGKTSDLAKMHREVSQLDKSVFYRKKFENLEAKDIKTILVDKMPQLSFDDVKKIVNSMYPDLSIEETTDKYILKGKTDDVEKAVEYLEKLRSDLLSERFKVVRISENVSIGTIQNVVRLYSPNLKIISLSNNKIILKGDPSEISKTQEVLSGLGLLDLAAGKSIQLLKVENLDPQEATKLLKIYFPDLKVDYLSKAQTFILVGTPDDVVGAMALLRNFSATYVPKVEKPEKKLENSIKFHEDGTFDISIEDFTLEEVLRYIADKLGKNIMISIPMPEKLKINSKGLSWENFLKIIEQNFGYVFNEVAGVVTPKKVKQVPEPEVKKYIYKVSYNIDEVKSLIEFYGGKTYVDKKNNLIIVTGITEEKKRELDKLIKEVSAPVKQVEIEARVIDKSLVDDLFRSITTLLSTNETMSGEPNVTAGKGEKTVSKTNVILGEGENIETIEQKISSSGLNIYTGVLSKLEYDKLMSLLLSQLGATIDISASKDNSVGNTLSSPKIVTISGNTAEIHVGDRVPYIKKTIDKNGREQVDIENIETGIRLQITPIVKSDDSIELDIVAEVSNISGTRYAGPEQGDLPIISSRNATTRVIIKNGETFVIGGLTTTVKTDSVSKLPVVGNLPFIGELFKTKKKVDQKRELIIFITAKVVN